MAPDKYIEAIEVLNDVFNQYNKIVEALGSVVISVRQRIDLNDEEIVLIDKYNVAHKNLTYYSRKYHSLIKDIK